MSAGILPPDPLFCFREAMGHIHALSFPQRNRDFSDLLLAATESGHVYFWDLESNRLQYKKLMGESIQAIHGIEYDIVTQEKSGSVKLWSIENNSTYRIQKTFKCYGGFCKSILVDNQLVLPQDKSTLECIDIHDFQSVRKFVPDSVEMSQLGSVMCLETFQIRNVKYILAGYESGDIILYDYLTAKQCAQLKLKDFLTSITFDSNKYLGVVSNSSNCLQVFGLDPETFELTIKADLGIHKNGCQVVKFRPDRRLFVAGGWDGKIRIFSWKTLRTLAVLKEHRKQISDIQFSPNTVRFWRSKIFAAGAADGSISLWNVYHNYVY